MKFTVNFIVIIAIFSLSAIPVTAKPIDGLFTANQVCSLYQSKNKKTNPDDLQTQAGQNYQVKEYLGKLNTPDWLRVKTDANQSKLRWVSAECGSFKANKYNSKQDTWQSHKNPSKCNSPNEYDGFVLALSWQNTFCEFNQRKRECRGLINNPELSANSEFSLHGLWPNKTSCGKKYGFCSNVTQKSRSFCDYPALSLSNSVRQKLNGNMPSAQFGTCLQRHEYWKHGACMTDSANRYFEVSLGLVEQFNASEFVKGFIKPQIGHQVNRQDFIGAFEKSFGKNSQHKLTLICQRGILKEVQLSLSKQVTTVDNLSLLLQQGKNAVKGNCPFAFIIDKSGY